MNTSAQQLLSTWLPGPRLDSSGIHIEKGYCDAFLDTRHNFELKGRNIGRLTIADYKPTIAVTQLADVRCLWAIQWFPLVTLIPHSIAGRN